MKSLILLCLLSPLKGQWDPNVEPGRSTFVHLFEWRWEDIAAECERFLGPKGFAGVQVSPPSENVIAWYDSGPQRPWWERYQPVSYRLETRSGSESQFQDMVSRCNAAGVRYDHRLFLRLFRIHFPSFPKCTIYADVVVNHMTEWWPSRTSATGGSLSYPTQALTSMAPTNVLLRRVTSKTTRTHRGTKSYLASLTKSVKDPRVPNCKLTTEHSGLNDLKQGSDYVSAPLWDFIGEVIVGYMNKLIDYGVAGCRIDASKHMWPGDLGSIFSRLSNLSTTHGFPSGTRPFVFQEVIKSRFEYFPSLDASISVMRIRVSRHSLRCRSKESLKIQTGIR
ncbi:unnamed protein product, partial [Darwinula stevensoni]